MKRSAIRESIRFPRVPTLRACTRATSVRWWAVPALHNLRLLLFWFSVATFGVAIHRQGFEARLFYVAADRPGAADRIHDLLSALDGFAPALRHGRQVGGRDFFQIRKIFRCAGERRIQFLLRRG